MSISIHTRHSGNSWYALSQSQGAGKTEDSNQGTGQAEAEKSGGRHRHTGDSIEISPEAMAYLAAQNAAGVGAAASSASASEETGGDLTVDEKKSFLTELQSQLSQLGTDSAVSDGSAEDVQDPLFSALTAMKETLSGVDLSASSEEEITDLFDKVTSSMDNARPQRPMGPPPMRGAGGPPPMNGMEEEEDEEDSISTEEEKSVLTTLQSMLEALEESDEDEQDPLAEALSGLKDKLTGYDAASATDEDTEELFDAVAETLKGSRPQPHEDKKGGPPAMLKAMGGITPPFVWALTGEESEQ
ncbi:hypothetical protein [Gorillibacterium sp. sgz5001074]|uniref:hypothetical protein n=1 Tax=Gorillibacterium sp. sgz5001074 TaxID=3446695 RepID=UPI003F66D098